MIVIDGVKYACERCIRGHRASKCVHSERPLVPVKKQGRPSTTCHHCKTLREEKNINPSGSCNCGKIEKEGKLFSIDDDILDRCFCSLGHECKCHAKRKRSAAPTNLEGKKHMAMLKSETPPQLDSLALQQEITKISPIFDGATNEASNVKSEPSSCCIPSVTDVLNSLNTNPNNGGKETKLDNLIPGCCSSSRTSSNVNESLLTTPRDQNNCCDTISSQSNKESEISTLLNDNSLTDLTTLKALTNDFIDKDPY
ncbi:transcriptional activator protein Cup2p [Monosporozyma unispora]|nr:hypothetical protein C6P44_004375 [Kazachstania unispora]